MNATRSSRPRRRRPSAAGNEVVNLDARRIEKALTQRTRYKYV